MPVAHIVRILTVLATIILTTAAAGRLVEAANFIECTCAHDCWCRRPGLSLFRWVIPTRHKPMGWWGHDEPAPSADDGRHLRDRGNRVTLPP